MVWKRLIVSRQSALKLTVNRQKYRLRLTFKKNTFKKFQSIFMFSAAKAMSDQNVWKEIIQSIPAEKAERWWIR